MKLADKAGILMVAGGVGRVVQIGLGVLLARLLAPDLYGTYRQIWLLVSGFLPLILMAIPMSFYYFVPRLDAERRRVFVWQTFWVVLAIGALSSVLLFVCAEWIGLAFHNPDLPAVLRVFAIYPLLFFPSNLLFPVAVSLDRHAQGAFVNLGFAFVQAIMTGLLLLAGAGLNVVFGALVALTAVNLAVSVLLLRRMLPGSGPTTDRSLLREQLAYSWPLGASTVVDIVNVELDKLIVSLRFMPDQFALFAIGATELPFLDVLRGSVNAVLRPAIASLHQTGDATSLMTLWRQALRKQGLFALGAFGFFIAHAPTFITVLYTERYTGSARLFQIYLLLIPLRLLGPGVLLASIGETRALMRASRLNLFLNLGLSVALLYPLGLAGPAVATVIALGASTFIQARKLTELLHLTFNQLFPTGALASMLGIGLLAGTLSRTALWVGLPPLATLVLAGGLHALLYLGGTWLVGLFTEEDRAFLRRWAQLAPLRR